MLFDTGFSDAVVRNAAKMQIDLLDLDYIVLSHGHNDHTGGLWHLLRFLLEAIAEGTAYRLPRVVAHPHCFYPRPKPPLPDIGAVLSVDGVRRFMPLELTASPVHLSPNLFFLGEIERKVPFEAFSPGLRRIVLPDGTEQADLPVRRLRPRLPRQRRACDRHGLCPFGDLQHDRARPQGLR